MPGAESSTHVPRDEPGRVVSRRPPRGHDPSTSVLVAGAPLDHPLVGIWAALLQVARRAEDQVVPPASGELGRDRDALGPVAAAVHGAREAAVHAGALLDAGYEQLVILPMPGSLEDPDHQPDLRDLSADIRALQLAHPQARIHDAVQAVDSETARVLADLVATPQQVSDALLAATIVRGFDGDPARLAGCVAALRSVLPDDTTIALRGSAVMGHAFRDGAPYDAGGPGSSDLDVVLIGEGAAKLWIPAARLLGGINTLPLSDKTPSLAPLLDGPRRKAQALVGRPLSVQAMARWFLDLRVALQGQPYVVLAGPP